MTSLTTTMYQDLSYLRGVLLNHCLNLKPGRLRIGVFVPKRKKDQQEKNVHVLNATYGFMKLA